MAIYFITSNKNKFNEASKIIKGLEQIEIGLPEIQEIDARKIIEMKLKEAFRHHKGPFIVDDTSLCFDCLKGLPGPLIKWFLEKLGREGLYDICRNYGNFKAWAVCMIGYAKNPEEIHFFEGRVDGKIVKPKGDYFGWDPVFMPDGYDRTFAEMPKDEKNSISHRRLALEKLKDFLNS